MSCQKRGLLHLTLRMKQDVLAEKLCLSLHLSCLLGVFLVLAEGSKEGFGYQVFAAPGSHYCHFSDGT